jgi:hypothetical protein
MNVYRLLLALLVAAVSCPAPAADAGSVFARTQDSVYVIRVQLASGAKQGSAVRISKRAVVTNCHVVADSVSIVVQTKSTQHEATVLHSDSARDLCTLQVSDLPPSDVPNFRRLDTVRVGERVFALGAPRGLELSLSEGIVAAIRDTEMGRLVQTTTPISPGSSGGALFDAQARLVGITTLQKRDSQNLNFAIPAEWIAEIPTRHVEPVRRTPSSSPEPQLLKLVCRGQVKSNALAATTIRGASEWTETVEAELNLAQPSVRLNNFSPTLITKRNLGNVFAAMRATKEPFVLTEIEDILRHYDSDTDTSTQGMRIVSLEILLNRKTAELTLVDSDTSMSTKDFQTRLEETRGQYQCERDAGRKF